MSLKRLKLIARGYTHDANGNITQVNFPRVVTQYIYNADNRLKNLGDAGYLML